MVKKEHGIRAPKGWTAMKNAAESRKSALFLAGIFALGLWARWYFLPFVSADYTNFLQKWYLEAKSLGGFASIGTSIGNYSPVYMYLIAALTYLPVYDLFAIKAVSVLFDLSLAAGMYCLVRAHTGSGFRAALAAAGIWLLPTVVINSAMWGQCDVIYTSFLVWMLYCLVKEKPLPACILYGVAFAFKLQSIFLFPLLVVCLLNGRVKLRHLAAGAGAYALLLLPAVLARGDVSVFFSTYAKQTSETAATALATNVPNLYMWFVTTLETQELLLPGFVLLAVCAVGVAVYFLWERQRFFSRDVLVAAAAFFAVLCPFVLPCMVERYFYLGDALLMAFAARWPKKLYAAATAWVLSLNTYMVFFFTNAVSNRYLLPLFVFVPLFAVGGTLVSLCGGGSAALPGGEAAARGAAAVPAGTHATGADAASSGAAAPRSGKRRGGTKA